MRRSVPALAVLLLVVACSETVLSGVDSRGFSGRYILIGVNGSPPPAPVSTSWLQGTLGSATMDIDPNGQYLLRIFSSAGELNARGNSAGDAEGTITLFGRDGAPRWQGQARPDSTILFPDFDGMTAVFRWVAPYRFGQ